MRAGVIKDASYVWWAIRPSLKHPTLELRAPDSCTRIEDTLAIASLYRCLVRHLVEHPEINAELTPVDRAVVVENKWRAQRYGVEGTFVDVNRGALNVTGWLDQVISDITDDATILGCLAEVQHCYAIVDAGTSADAQLKIYDDAQAASDNHGEALRAVIDWIAAETLRLQQ